MLLQNWLKSWIACFLALCAFTNANEQLHHDHGNSEETCPVCVNATGRRRDDGQLAVSLGEEGLALASVPPGNLSDAASVSDDPLQPDPEELFDHTPSIVISFPVALSPRDAVPEPLGPEPPSPLHRESSPRAPPTPLA